MTSVVSFTPDQTEDQKKEARKPNDSLQKTLNLAKSEAAAFGLQWQQPSSTFAPASITKQFEQAFRSPEQMNQLWRDLNPHGKPHHLELHAGEAVSAMFAVAPLGLRETIADLHRKAVSEAVLFVNNALAAATQGTVEPIALATLRCMDKGTTSLYTELKFPERAANYASKKLATIDPKPLEDALSGAGEIYQTALANGLTRELGLRLKKTSSDYLQIENLIPEIDRATQQARVEQRYARNKNVANATLREGSVVAVGQNPKLMRQMVKEAQKWQKVGEGIDFGKILYRTATTEHSITISEKSFKALETKVLQSLIKTPGYVSSARVFSAVAIEARAYNLERSAVEWIANRTIAQYLRPTMTTQSGFQLYGLKDATTIARRVHQSALWLNRQGGILSKLWETTSQTATRLFQGLQSQLTTLKRGLDPVKEILAQSATRPTSEKDHEMLYRTGQISPWRRKHLDRQLQDLAERVTTLERGAEERLEVDRKSYERTERHLKMDPRMVDRTQSVNGCEIST